MWPYIVGRKIEYICWSYNVGITHIVRITRLHPTLPLPNDKHIEVTNYRHFKKASFSGFSMTKGEQRGHNPALNECTEDIKGIRRQRNEG